MYTAMNTRNTRELAAPTAPVGLNASRTQMLEINESIQTDTGKVYRSAVRSKVWSFIAVMLGLLALGSSTVAQTSTPLTIDCPPNRTNWLCGVSSFAFVSYSLPTTTGSCPTNAIVTCTPPSGGTFILGTTTVSCRATNSCRQSATCNFNITVVRDTVPPVIQCPTNRIVWLCGTASTARVSFTLPSATDNADSNVVVSCSPTPNSSFPLGTSTVTCTATDDCTNRTTCTFTVTIARDTTPPVIQCPPSINGTACSASGAVATYPTPTATDNADFNVAVACSPVSGSVFPLGSTTVTCTATDNCTNQTACTFLVRVTRDTTPPVITCPSNRLVWTCSPTGTVENFNTPTATDNLDATPTVACSPPSGSVFPLGTNIVTCTATDDCTNRSICSFTVTVRPPLLYDGLCHTPLGLAVLNVNTNDELEISGFGTSGRDGVRIDLGESQGLRWSINLPAGDVDGRDFLIWQRGGSPAGADVPISNMAYTFKQGRLTVTPSATSYEFKLLLRGEVVHRQTGRSGSFDIPECHHVEQEHCVGEEFAGINPRLPYCINFLTVECDWDTTTGPVRADALVVTPEDPLPPFTAITSIEILGRNLPVLTLHTERLLMFGSPEQPSIPHRALGQARLVAEDGTLTLADLGPSGMDGARIELGERQGLRWRMENPPGLPEGDMDIEVLGRTAAGAEVPIRRISHHYRSGRTSVTPGTGPYEFKLLLRGQVVFQQAGRTGDVDIPECHHVENEHCVGDPFAGWSPFVPYCLNVLTIECDWETPAGPVRADTLVLTPEDPVPSVTAISAVQILGRNVRNLPVLKLHEERVLTFSGSELELACPSNITSRTCSTNPVPVSFPPPVVSGGTCTLPASVVCVPSSGSLFPPGVTTVQCTATNVCGERAVCSFTVTVLADTTPPVITCPTNRTVTTSNPLGAPLSLNVETDDDWDAVPTVACVPPLTSVFPIGVTMVTCTATDDCGNRSQCNFKVTVVAGPGLPGTDTNGDGLSDIWQAHFNAHGLAPGEDTDGDGASNDDESLVGTDPQSASSVFELTISTELKAGGGLCVSVSARRRFDHIGNFNFRPEYKRALSQEFVWEPIGTPVRGTEYPYIRWEVPITGPLVPPTLSTQGFFRVVVNNMDDDGDGITAWEESIIGTSDLTPNTHGNPGGDYLAAQDWIVACGQVMFSPSVWNIDVPSARIQGRFLLNSRPFPSSFLQGANFFLRRISTGDEVYLGLSNNDTFDRRVVPGIYDVIYEHKIGDEVPLNSVAVVIAGLEISGDQVFDIDVPMVGVSGAYLLNGVPFSVSSIEFGKVLVRDAQTRSLTMLGDTRDQTYSARLIPGTYDLMFSHGSGNTVPANVLTAFRRDVPIMVSGPLDMDVPTVSVTGIFTVNGAPTPGSVNDSGYIYLVDPDTGSKLLLGSTRFGHYQRALIPGAYDVVYEQISAISMPANLSARFLAGVQFVADGTNDINIPVVEISGAFLVNGVPAPNNSLDFANIQLRQGEDTVYLGQTRFGHFSVRVIPGTYNVNFESLSSGSIMPANTNAVIASVVIAGPTVFDINIPAVDFAADVRFNGGNFPGPIAGESARLFLEDPLTGDLIPLAFDYPTSDHVARRMVRGTYRVRYEYESGTTLPRNTFATLGSSLVLTQNVQTVIDVRAVALSGDFLLNSGAFPGGPFAGVTARSLLPGDSLYLGGTQSGAYSTVIVPGRYSAFYNWTVGDLIPRNQNARLICPRR